MPAADDAMRTEAPIAWRDALLAARERVAAGDDPGPGLSLRPLVHDAWRRALSHAVDPERSLPGIVLGDDEFREYRAQHELTGALPVIRRLLADDADENGLLVAVGDARGRLLWVEGDRTLRRRAEDMRFVPGADWSEERIGTSAPGTSLALDRAVQIRGAEHFHSIVHPWSCTAAPVHDPVSGAILGVIDITGDDQAVAPHTLALVSATVAAVESELRIQRLQTDVQATIRRSRMRRAAPDRALHVQGGDPPRLGGLRLSLRHAEILLLLAWHPEGLTAERLAGLLYETDASSVTLRAELVRLRRVLEGAGVPVPASRPYRLAEPIATDAREVLDLLDRGAHLRALEHAAGPVLPESTAPGVARIRAEVASRLREAMLADAAVEHLVRYADTEAARDDLEVQQACLRLLPSRSPKRARVVARIEAIQRELA
ncbi:GAF domain-containing protein [Agromyces sp. SYSU T00194]|uniref:GAF domain-containing protein n=1 Tax=Agromyces chitinivorans TaxID=3158560 RepID=UPI003394A40D